MRARFKPLLFSMGSMLGMAVILRILEHLSGADFPLRVHGLGTVLAGMVSYPFHLSLVKQWDENKRLRTELERMVLDLQHKAETDGLTGLLTRSAFVERALAMPADRQAWLLVIDIDHFKDINDTHGHLAGDAILRVVSYAIRSALRPDDVGGRMGGEEFAICLASQDADGARRTAELLRADIQALGVEAPSGGMLRATVSIGLASYHGGRSLKEALHAADLAMYGAKMGGRNQVRLAA